MARTLIAYHGLTSIHFPHPREDPQNIHLTRCCSTSIHFPHPREDKVCPKCPICPEILQSTSLIRGKTGHSEQSGAGSHYFNPLPSSEGRRPVDFQTFRQIYFNPLPSSEGRPFRRLRLSIRLYFNPLPSSEGRLRQVTCTIRMTHFNPLPSSEGRRVQRRCRLQRRALQSTSLIRGKTLKNPAKSIHQITSIHFPHPREDSSNGKRRGTHKHFNPLPSSEGRLYRRFKRYNFRNTSIHFPHPREDIFLRLFCVPVFTSIHFPHPREDPFFV